MKITLGSLNSNGEHSFRASLQGWKDGGTADIDLNILTDSHYTNPLPNGGIELDLDSVDFSSRYAIAEYLVRETKGLDQSLLNDGNGVWTWLALLFFYHLCPPDPTTNQRTVRRTDNYIFDATFRNRARHSIRTPFILVRDYGDKVKFMFNQSPSIRGELTEQLTSRQSYFSCAGIFDAAHRLYSQPDGSAKFGSASNGPGSARRYFAVLDQLERTYELSVISGEEIIKLLPPEFDRFCNTDESTSSESGSEKTPRKKKKKKAAKAKKRVASSAQRSSKKKAGKAKKRVASSAQRSSKKR